MMGASNTKYLSDLSESDSSEEDSDEISVDITTDAAFRTNVTLPKAQDVLNLAKVLEIEKSLDTEEIVSLVFLLFEDTHYALQELNLMLRGSSGKKLLHTWASVQEGRRNDWQNPFIEALSVIKNYEVLRNLGYRKDILKDHFLPHSGWTSIHLNEVKKVSFLICEQLTSVKTKTLLDHVANQFPQQSTEFKEFDLHFLELCFMKWEVTKTVTLFDIKKILKIMEEEHLCNLLEDVLKKVSDEREQTTRFITPQLSNENVEPSMSATYDSQSIRDAFFEHQLRNRSHSNSDRNMPTTSVDNHHQQEYVKYDPFMDYQLPVVDITHNDAEIPDEIDNNRYNIDPNMPGIVLIINQENFYTEFDEQYKKLLPPNTSEKLESRLGTGKDKEHLEQVFKKFGFTVVVEDNLNHIDMLDKIKEVVKSVREESSLFICILSHGDKGIVYGSNSCRVKVNHIKDIMYRSNKANLTGKPKILILQSCQGEECQKIDDDDEDDEAYRDDDDMSLTTDGPSAPLRDMFTFWATLPGYAAIRNKKTGSWFIQALCKKMVEIGNKHHFADICTRIKNEVTQQTWTKNETEKQAMTPYVQSTLLKDFYLPRLKS